LTRRELTACTTDPSRTPPCQSSPSMSRRVDEEDEEAPCGRLPSGGTPCGKLPLDKHGRRASAAIGTSGAARLGAASSISKLSTYQLSKFQLIHFTFSEISNQFLYQFRYNNSLCSFLYIHNQHLLFQTSQTSPCPNPPLLGAQPAAAWSPTRRCSGVQPAAC
jgi:hypothetical protein